MSRQSPLSLFENAAKEAVKLLLDKPSLMKKLPATLQRDLAVRCLGILTLYFKRMRRERNRKSTLTDERLRSLFSLKEFDSIPKRLKQRKIFAFKQTLNNLEKKEQALFAPFV